MRNNILLVAVLCFFIVQAPRAQESDIIENIAGYFRSSNTQELSKYFASTVELTILEEEDVYSKVQAEIILKDFFTKHSPSSIKTLHRLNSNPTYRLGVLSMATDNGKFRVSFSMKNTSGKFVITEISIKTTEE